MRGKFEPVTEISMKKFFIFFIKRHYMYQVTYEFLFFDEFSRNSRKIVK